MDMGMRSSLDQKIGITRMAENSLLPGKIRSSAHFSTFDSKSKRGVYSTDKVSEYGGYKFNSEIRLPSIKRTTTKFIQNPEMKN